ncbi:MAG: 4Fe-4S binding protein [Eubacteriales bacterium]|nr:4Fe-4S binding protein [Eubacteriales bacterium]MDY3332327.1 4Fe-4S binding protein [Gallibacter sp.]
MIRNIVSIDADKCNGCGLCVNACHEGAIAMVDGKAKLIRDDYCDGLGHCLPECPTGAISIIEREAAAYDEEAVQANIKAKNENKTTKDIKCGGGCPGSAMRELKKNHSHETQQNTSSNIELKLQSQLQQWPVQIQLVPVNAPYFDGAKLLIAADCTAFAYANFHNEFMKNKITIIGCPKLDPVDYSEKLTEIIKQNDIKEVTILKMEVPCCNGIENYAKKALQQSGKFIPWQVVTISINGEIVE